MCSVFISVAPSLGALSCASCQNSVGPRPRRKAQLTDSPLCGIQCGARLVSLRRNIFIGVGVGIGIAQAGSMFTRLPVDSTPALPTRWFAMPGNNWSFAFRFRFHPRFVANEGTHRPRADDMVYDVVYNSTMFIPLACSSQAIIGPVWLPGVWPGFPVDGRRLLGWQQRRSVSPADPSHNRRARDRRCWRARRVSSTRPADSVRCG